MAYGPGAVQCQDTVTFDELEVERLGRQIDEHGGRQRVIDHDVAQVALRDKGRALGNQALRLTRVERPSFAQAHERRQHREVVLHRHQAPARHAREVAADERLLVAGLIEL